MLSVFRDSSCSVEAYGSCFSFVIMLTIPVDGVFLLSILPRAICGCPRTSCRVPCARRFSWMTQSKTKPKSSKSSKFIIPAKVYVGVLCALSLSLLSFSQVFATASLWEDVISTWQESYGQIRDTPIGNIGIRVLQNAKPAIEAEALRLAREPLPSTPADLALLTQRSLLNVSSPNLITQGLIQQCTGDFLCSAQSLAKACHFVVRRRFD